MSFAIAAFLRPFIALVVIWAVVYPLRKLFWKIIPPGKIKAVLFQPRENNWKDNLIMVSVYVGGMILAYGSIWYFLAPK